MIIQSWQTELLKVFQYFSLSRTFFLFSTSQLNDARGLSNSTGSSVSLCGPVFDLMTSPVSGQHPSKVGGRWATKGRGMDRGRQPPKCGLSWYCSSWRYICGVYFYVFVFSTSICDDLLRSSESFSVSVHPSISVSHSLKVSLGCSIPGCWGVTPL